jgi:hypothetical protein
MSRRILRLLCLALLAATLAADAAGATPRGLERAPESFRVWIDSLPEGQRRVALRRLGNMTTHRRNQLFHRWEALEEGDRRAFQQRMLERIERRERGDAGPARRARLEEMSPERRAALAPLLRRWRSMEPAERQRMRGRLERFRALEPAEQEALVERRFEAKPAAERARILESLREASEALPRRAPAD